VGDGRQGEEQPHQQSGRHRAVRDELEFTDARLAGFVAGDDGQREVVRQRHDGNRGYQVETSGGEVERAQALGDVG